MHLVAHAVLIKVVQRVARGDGHQTDVRHVVDNHLLDLAADEFRRRGL